MSGIYIHIPFCKQACHYCDFHFSTSMKKKDEMITALCDEIRLRKSEIDPNENIETIYFGGGTPTVLSIEELTRIIEVIYKNYSVIQNPEITVEANPDDLTEEKIKSLSSSDVNRLSIGIQSFFQEDLQLMNRAHNANEAKECLAMVSRYFENISIDLIYGIPNMSIDQWKQNIQVAMDFKVPHISCYALTVEPRTALKKLIQNGKIEPVSDELAQEHFEILVDTLENRGFVHYELSNFGKPGYFSKNNTAYWKGKNYLGIGPSAHSFNGKQRSWNINNNIKYIKALQQQQIPREVEDLSKTDRYNEYIMTGLRTIWGVSLQKIEHEFGEKHKEYLMKQAQKHIDKHLLFIDDDTLLITKKGKFLSDGIASDLFLLNLG
ncbi:radical SAM family heme chaperone HemW [Aquimarina algiphila]|uniref:Heme chaperone HemW n=1 Tax=Aquimarina algiphila TaxID=2047982 RepID=A0A554VD96_9FLAO|nr:radical SAM family heme chaperone HemW [Aquimarina algiphila]TSE04824.1 radical SAM family heme chaperone HemW [Aquimarina algiphila]